MFFRKKPNDGQTTWAVQRNKNSSLKKKQEKRTILLNADITEKKVLLGKRFY